MSLHPKHLIRYGLAVLTAAAAVGCKSDGTGTDDGEIALALNPTSASVAQGGSTTIAATLTRSGGFTGTVQFGVTGNPAGVTGAVSNEVTTGLVTTATITVTVGAAVTPGTYPLVVTGTGSGVTATTATFTLTVTAAPAPAYTLALLPAALSIVQGAATPTTTVTLVRTNFTGNVTLSVENLPTGVTASFNPASPVSGNSSVLTLTVAGNAPIGTFSNLLVRGVSSLTDRTAPLTLTVTAAPAQSYTLSLSAPALTIPQGGNGQSTVTLVRTNFTNNVILTLEGAPAGVTGAFNPTSTSTNTSVLTVTVGAAVAPGVYNLVVRGVDAEFVLGDRTAPLTLTVTAAPVVGNFTLSTTPATSVSLTQGANANVTVNINRTGGNSSNIALTATVTGTLPTGMTLTLVPTSTTTNSSTLTVTTTVATPLGTYPIVIRGNFTGLGEQTVNLNVIVTASSGSGNAQVSFAGAGCDPEDRAVWLAFMDGTSGTWTAVTGVANVYQFNITQSKGSFAYVTLGTGTSTIIVQHMTQAELTAGTLNFCGAVTPATRVANGTVSNLPSQFLAQISFGGGFTSAFANGLFQITFARDGTFDLIGYASPITGGSSGDRIFVKRGENPAPAGNFSVPVNFIDATLSASAAAASATLQGLVGGETLVNHSMSFFTGGSACVPASLYSLGTTAASFNLYGVPASLRLGTDMHSISITAGNGTTSFRFLLENFLDIAARAATPFVLPAQLPVPVATDAGGPYKRPSIAVTGVPAELNVSHTMTYQDQTATGKTGVVTASQGWVGGSNLTLVLANFAGVGTFNNAWAPATGDALNWSISSAGGTFTGACTAGQRFVSSTRIGTL